MGISYVCNVKILDIIYQATDSNITRSTGTSTVAATITAAHGMHLWEQSWHHLFCTCVPTHSTVALHTPTDSEWQIIGLFGKECLLDSRYPHYSGPQL